MGRNGGNEDIKAIRDVLIKNLKDAGFRLMLYESFSTNSIYLKLDYGVMHSIRISDHDGKKHLQYRYNVLTTITGTERRDSYKGLEMFFYSPLNVGDLITRLTIARKAKLLSMGEQRYKNLMLNKKMQNLGAVQGFWAQAVEV